MTRTENNTLTTIAQKVKRLQSGAAPRVLDLFSGCGGMSLGFLRAGCQLIGGIEKDGAAVQSYLTNFHIDESDISLYEDPIDITAAGPLGVMTKLGRADHREAVDIVIGGPPCQAYSAIGKAKLNHLRSLNKIDVQDSRADLFKYFLAFVAELIPVAVVMENVPDALNYEGLNIAEAVSVGLERIGYIARYTLLNAAGYGVPQYRERLILVAVHRQYSGHPGYPAPTHEVLYPTESAANRSRIYSLYNADDRRGHVVLPPSADAPLPKCVSTEEAIGDLPHISTRDDSSLSVWRDPEKLHHYSAAVPQTDYQELMRTWKGYESLGFVSGNVIRLTPRDFPIFSRMKEGDDYVAALAVAEIILQERAKKTQQHAGEKLSRSQIDQLRKATVPPYSPDKFLSKWYKLRRDYPSRTIVAHLGVDSYSHIHYDDCQARTITIREAARLQSFPDGFQFRGNIGEVFRQIGNAVPPLLAFHIARTLLSFLRNT